MNQAEIKIVVRWEGDVEGHGDVEIIADEMPFIASLIAVTHFINAVALHADVTIGYDEAVAKMIEMAKSKAKAVRVDGRMVQ